MRLRSSILIGLCVLLTTNVCLAKNDAANVFARGEMLLQSGDFSGALKVLTKAAKLAPNNEAYRREATLVRRVIQIRSRHDKIEDTERWTMMAKALHTFYHDRKVYTAALDLDTRAHAKLGTDDSAVMLASTQLALDMNEDAATMLGGLDKDKSTPHTRALLGIALARQGKIDKAKALLEPFKAPEKHAAELALDFARLRALVRDDSGTIQMLKQYFELTPPSRLEKARTAARECTDLKRLAETEAFAAALKTDSKVKESSCSGGTSCGSCPNRSSCSSASKDADKDKKPEQP